MGDEKGLKFPSVWDWSLQFTAKDRTLFFNPLYIGKSTPCVQNGAVKSFRRTKVNGRALPGNTWCLLMYPQVPSRGGAARFEGPCTFYLT